MRNIFNKRIYLDSAAGITGNASSPHEEGRRAKQMLEDARTAIARLVEVQSDDVVFTSGATESNALALLGIAKKGDHVLYLPSAHASIVENIKLLSERGVEVEALPITEERVDCEKLKEFVRPETTLITMDAVCGETGVVWNTREVAEVLHSAGKTKKGCALAARPIQHPFFISPAAFLHVDASQAPLTEKISRSHFGADMLSLDASKVGAARGIGALIAHRTIPISPLYAGGGQERGLRSGSIHPELAKSFANDLYSAVRHHEQFRSSAEKARAQLIKNITSFIPNVLINEGSSPDRQAPNILNLSFPGGDPSRRAGAEVDTDYLVALLDEDDFAVSTRSACETDSEEGSRAVFALTGDILRARSTLRISWDKRVRLSELTRFAKALKRAVAFIGY